MTKLVSIGDRWHLWGRRVARRTAASATEDEEPTAA